MFLVGRISREGRVDAYLRAQSKIEQRTWDGESVDGCEKPRDTTESSLGRWGERLSWARPSPSPNSPAWRLCLAQQTNQSRPDPSATAGLLCPPPTVTSSSWPFRRARSFGLDGEDRIISVNTDVTPATKVIYQIFIHIIAHSQDSGPRCFGYHYFYVQGT